MNRVFEVTALGLLVAAGAWLGAPTRPGVPSVARHPQDAAESRPLLPSVTVYPVMLGDVAHQETAEVLGVLLERAGLQQVELQTASFTPDRKQAFPEQVSAFASFVSEHALATDYALFGAFVGSPKEGVKEVRGVLVDRKGRVAWSECQLPGEAAFDRAHPDCPMDCAVFLVRRLKSTLNLADPLRQDAPKGRLAARLEARSGVASEAERAAMESALAKLRSDHVTARVRVYPARIGKGWSAAEARRLAKLINDRGLMKATAADAPLEFTTDVASNEQRVLWSGARSIQEAVRKSERGTEYLLLTDYLMAGEGKVGAVHAYLLAPDGSLVIVDYQNSHHDDFERIVPASAPECSDLVALRLAGYLGSR